MKPKLIATSKDGLFSAFATIENSIGDATCYWGYIDKGGKKSKIINLTRFLEENNDWAFEKDIQNTDSTLPAS